MNKSKLLIIGMLLGFERGHEIYDGVDWNSDVAAGLLEARSISKEDFFSTTPKGKSFFEYKKGWENLRKVFDFVKKNGEQLTLADFKKIVVGSKSAIDLAVDCKALDEIFTPEIWAGHSKEMEEFWFSIDKWKRPTKNFDELRIQVARLEGRTIREDKLKSMNISVDSMHNALKLGNYAEMKRKLEPHGEYLRLDDAKMCDSDGDHALYTGTAWTKFEELYADWEQHGEIPDAAFFQFRRGTRSSIVETAFSNNAEKKVFNAKVFAGRPEELLKLYESLKEDHRKKIDVKAVLAEIVEKQCSDQIVIDRSMTLTDLVSPLYVFHGGDKTLSVTALGLKRTWENIDDIREILALNGERLTLGHLRQSCGFAGESYMLKAARLGHFDKVLEIAARNGERIELNDLLAKSDGGKNVLSVLAETGKLEQILRPEIWVRRVGDLATLWENMPFSHKSEKKQDFLDAQTQANQLSLRQLAAGRTPSFSMG